MPPADWGPAVFLQIGTGRSPIDFFTTSLAGLTGLVGFLIDVQNVDPKRFLFTQSEWPQSLVESETGQYIHTLRADEQG